MNNYEKIEELLLTKNYNQLSETERSFVSKIMTAEEYGKMRNSLHSLKAFMNGEAKLQSLLKSVEDSVMDSFEKHHQSKQDHLNKKIWLKRSVPLWAVAASLALLIIAGGWLMQWKSQTRINYLAKIDTVYQEKRIVDTVFIEKEPLKPEYKIKSRIATQEYPADMVGNSTSNTVVASTGLTIPNPEMLRNAKRFPVGTSMSEDASKEKLTVEIF
jgi:hypothetical protein